MFLISAPSTPALHLWQDHCALVPSRSLPVEGVDVRICGTPNGPPVSLHNAAMRHASHLTRVRPGRLEKSKHMSLLSLPKKFSIATNVSTQGSPGSETSNMQKLCEKCGSISYSPTEGLNRQPSVKINHQNNLGSHCTSRSGGCFYTCQTEALEPPFAQLTRSIKLNQVVVKSKSLTGISLRPPSTQTPPPPPQEDNCRFCSLTNATSRPHGSSST